MGKLMTTAEVAEMLQVSTSLVTRMCREGQIPFVQICSTRRFDSDEILKWIKEHYKGNN